MMRMVGGKLRGVCHGCGQIVRVDKPLLGGLHICTTEEEQVLYAEEIKRRYEFSCTVLEKAT